MYDLSCYDEKFYDTYGHEAEKMARWFLPLLHSVIPFKSLVDVGCGEGHYLAWLEKNRPEVRIAGLEGSLVARDRADNVVMKNVIYPCDFRTQVYVSKDGDFDIALSLEVAEHIEAEYADVFVDTLCSLSSNVVMTAAPPGQGGLMHVNEQPKAYWRAKFAQRGYYEDDWAGTLLMEGATWARKLGLYVTDWMAPNLQVYRNER